ncbi:Transposon Ty3-G Gag-Pol polyprotein [Senna tora]|uniref:Transposon Ty3-G Gag-Pol polyprotein n=1 Tax=Senna tora TaxID=362788 RepID=A0A834W9C7_9FABA|nr:Transposon Ty3-G Gag-Pol polyprotein [Senna tora]
MKSAAYSWYKWMSKNGKLKSWQGFIDWVLLWFGSSLYDDPKAQLKDVKQAGGTIADYQARFEEISTKVHDIPEPWLISFFIAGLDNALRNELIVAQPTSYFQTVSLAKLYEQKFINISSPKPFVPKPFVSKPSFPSTAPLALPAPPPRPIPLSSIPAPTFKSPSVSSNPPFKKLTAAEIKAKREKGECYYCDSKYSPTHKCAAQCLLLIGHDELQALQEMEPHVNEPPNDMDYVIVNPEISLNALTGQRSITTIKLSGKCNNIWVNILVDGGSTDNFIKSCMVQKLKLTTVSTPKFKVFVGSGAFLWCSSKCANVKLTVQQHTIITDLFVVDLQGVDVVLGGQWMRTLGPIMMDYEKLTMDFTVNGQQVHLQGEVAFDLEPLSSKQLEHMKTAGSLPPVRDDDHRIHLSVGTSPVNVRPYRYPFYQKSEIEKLFVVETDASTTGIGAVLSQDKHPIAFFSKQFAPRMRCASAYVRELFAITQAVWKWRHYLLGREFVIVTDHRSLKHLMKQTIQTPEQEHYLRILLGFHYVIVYRPGKFNSAADALSRVEVNALESENSACSLICDIWEDIRRENQSSHILQKLHQEVSQGLIDSAFKLDKGILWFRNRVHIPEDSVLIQSYHTSLKMSPYEALYGRPPPTLLSYVPGTSAVHLAYHWCQDRERLKQVLLSNLSQAQNRMKQQADGKKRDKEFQVGEWVWLKLHKYKQASLAVRVNFKLSKKYYGPYKILARVGAVAYHLELPSTTKIHPVFHISLLKPFVGDTSKLVVPDNFPCITAEELSPYAILDSRMLEVVGVLKRQVLVEWTPGHSDEASWEDVETLCSLFPSLNLEDKVVLEGVEVDTAQPKSVDAGPSEAHSGETEQEGRKGKRARKPPVWASDYA